MAVDLLVGPTLRLTEAEQRLALGGGRAGGSAYGSYALGNRTRTLSWVVAPLCLPAEAVPVLRLGPGSDEALLADVEKFFQFIRKVAPPTLPHLCAHGRCLKRRTVGCRGFI